MKLEGTLDAFSLADVFSLLSMTKKSGTLHLKRAGQPGGQPSMSQHGMIHLQQGSVTGARSDVRRQALGRRLVGAGLVGDEALASSVEAVLEDPAVGLGRTLVEKSGLSDDVVHEVAGEQATDAVFDLLRWASGGFVFLVDDPDPDDVGLRLPVDALMAEGQRRIAEWADLTAAVPAPDALVSFAPAPSELPVLNAAEWQLLGLVDGHRSVAQLAEFYGRGDFALVKALAGMVARGLLVVHTPGDGDATGAVVRRQRLLAALEGELDDDVAVTGAAASGATASGAAAPGATEAAGSSGRPPQTLASIPAQVIPERPEPFTPTRRVEHADREHSVTAGARAHPSAGPTGPVVGGTHGSAALAPDHSAQPFPVLRDPSVNKSLLLRLIAGVRGL